LEIVYILLEKKLVTAKQLAEQFGVSQRTIYRDIDTLGLAGIPIYTEQGKGGGISLMPEFVLDKSILSEQEQYKILSALQALSGIESVETDQVLTKLSALFKKSASNWLQVDFSGWNSASSDFFTIFKTAILERKIVEFDYYSSYNEKTRRRIEPVQLWFKEKAWYIYGFCLKRQDVRVFKLVRIKNLTITNKQFSARALPSVYENSGAEKERNPDITLKLRIAAEMTHRVLDEFREDMIKRQADGSFIVSVTWQEDQWVYGFLLSFGEYIEVLEPKHVQKILKSIAQKISKKYP
jgi:predicted DNA-binding transcriptional regulator YafY